MTAKFLAVMLVLITFTSAVPTINPDRSVMIWLLAANRDGSLSNATQWESRIANVKAHAENLTAISPCMYYMGADGSFAKKPTLPGRVDGFNQLYPHLKDFAEMGLKIYPLIAGPPNINGQAAVMHNTEAFINAAVAESVTNGYTGYNFDNEMRGKTSESSWSFLKPYGAPWIKFLDKFADELHTVNKTLSVDIAGCCGWIDPLRPKAPVGHCAGAFAAHEFVYTSCAQYASSKVDRVYAMGSYGLAINGPDPNPRLPYNYTYGELTALQVQLIQIHLYKY
jgi:hypothetical protein